MLRQYQKRYLWLGPAIVIALAAMITVHFTSTGESTENDEQAASAVQHDKEPTLALDAEERRRAGIKVEKIELTERAETIQAFGTVSANRNKFARVTPPITGRVVKVDVDLGDTVRAGESLATLQSPELAELRTALRQGQAEAALAKSNLERAEKLSTDGSIAQKELLRARSDFERAQATVTAVQAKLVTLEVPIVVPPGSSPALLSVVAPLSGTVVERAAVLGEYAQAYQSMFTVADLSTVWVETNLYDRDFGEVVVGAAATVSVSAYPNQRFSGTVTYIGNILDKDTRTAMARVEIANPGNRLKPGVFADVTIDKAARAVALRVPESALILLQGQMTAFVARGEGFESVPVEIGGRNSGMVTVKSGLEVGDEVVVHGAYALKARLLKSQIGDAH
ncbi:MAG: efflux RND transporter periplasmic adaptor subunit [Proteobacteria bacterium]|nr:efflux RND transporter periplasmic adaptor subunit [Pseudomonadota bacterium]